MISFLSKARHIFVGYTAGKAQESGFQCRTIMLVAAISIPTAASFIIINYLHDHQWLAMMLSISVLMLLPCLLLSKHKNHLPTLRNLMMINGVFTFISLFVDGGIEGLSFMWTLMFPFLAFLLVGLPVAWYWIIGYFSLQSAIIILSTMGLYTLPYNQELLIYFPIAFIFFSFVAATFEMHFERLHVRYEESIADLKALQLNLENNIQQRTTALLNTNKKLEKSIKEHEKTENELKNSEQRFFQAQKMESVGTLVGGIAHDFNNMLAGINANLFMIKRKISTDPEVTGRTDNIEQLVMSASDMIRQLLTFARKDNVEFSNFELSGFLEEAYKLSEISVSERIKIRFENETKNIWVQANKTQLQQVLMNLVNNARDAVKHSDDPSIIVKLERYSPSERFKRKYPHLNADEYAAFSIMDNGKGIPPHEVDKIFEPFFTTKAVGEGTGLGLAMCYGAIHSHHGIITVQSELGRGTVFRVFLPIHYNMMEDETVTSSINIAGSGETILIADDDQTLREAQKEALSMLGYNVIEACNGKEAVAEFQEHQSEIQLTMLDLTMPVMGGVKAAKLIRELQPTTPIIFVTGYDRDATLNNDGLPDMQDTIVDKPFTMDKLNKVIQSKLANTTPS